MNTAARRARELAATSEGIARGKESTPRRTREFPAKMKDSRTKIVGSTILGNAKSKMPNTWRWTYFFFGKMFRDLANSNKWQISIA